jgi:hypothetical protein
MKLIVLCLFLLTTPSIFASYSTVPPFYYLRRAQESRQFEDQSRTREVYKFETERHAEPWIVAYTTCFIGDTVFLIHTRSRIRRHSRTLTILSSQYESARAYGRTCAAALHKGTYHYRMSEDGKSVLLGEDKSTTRWRRHEQF